MISSAVNSLLGKHATEGYFQPQSDQQRKHSLHQGVSEQRASEDTVELSPAVPQPLREEELGSALMTAARLGQGEPLKQRTQDVLRMDRVQAALVALEVMDANPTEGRRLWPPGVPRPSAEELEEAYRRLSQRLIQAPDATRGNADTQERRRSLLDQYRMTDFDLLSAQVAASDDE